MYAFDSQNGTVKYSVKNIKTYASLESSKDIAIAIAAYANTQGGHLWFGVQSSLGVNRVVGLAGDFKGYDILNHLSTYFDAKPNYNYRWTQLDANKSVLIIDIEKSKQQILIDGIRYEMRNNEIVKIEGVKKMDYTKVFIVHGRDNESKQEVARFVEKIGLEAIILHEQVSRSQTIIEKIEEHSNVGFAIVLYTPCDEGRLKGTNDLAFRARQNVVFEHGFLMGKIGRSNVFALVKGEVETPNDISGVVYENMDDNGAWKMSVAKELKATGYDIDFNKFI